METQPPLLGGTVGNLARVRNNLPTLAELLGITPPLESRVFVCAHCEHEMLKEYLVWHMNAKYVSPFLLSITVWELGVDIGLGIEKSLVQMMFWPGLSNRKISRCSVSVTAATTTAMTSLITKGHWWILSSTVRVVARFIFLFCLLYCPVYFYCITCGITNVLITPSFRGGHPRGMRVDG